MTVDLQCMSTTEIAQSLQSAQLEQQYQQTLSQAERIYEEERARSLRVQLVLLENAYHEAQEQMDSDEDEIIKLESTNDELRDHLADSESQYQAVQMELKAHLRDLDRYKTEIEALNAARVDSTTLLSEKLALSRELTTLKPELEHLKSQAVQQQNLLKQKLALERELSAAQVEIETEKRTVQRLKAKDKSASTSDAALTDEIEQLKQELAKERRVAKDAAFKDAARMERIEELEQDLARAKRSAENKSNSVDEAMQEEIERLKQALEKEKRKNVKSSSIDSSLQTEVEELKKELAKTRREAQKAERENLKKAAEWDSQKEVLEDKLDAFRNKLRTTKEQLKEANDALERAEQAKFAAATEASKVRLNGVNPRKRNVARFDPDMTIGTPGHGGPAKKQRISVNPADKSNFSITPFLNKTMSILPESPEDRVEQEKVDEMLNSQVDAVLAEAEKEEGDTAKAGPKNAKVAKKATTAKTRSVKPLQESTNPKTNTAVKKSALPKVIEEEGEQEGQQDEKDRNSESMVEKKKAVIKRSTIFDEEEEAAPKRTKRLNLGGLKSNGLGLGKISLGSKSKVLAEFSPLKKDRKAVDVL